MTRDDPGLLVVTGGVSGQLENLGEKRFFNTRFIILPTKLKALKKFCFQHLDPNNTSMFFLLSVNLSVWKAGNNLRHLHIL